MNSAEELARANRQMVAERTALLAEVARLRQTLNQRSVDTATEFVDGLLVLLELAAKGDTNARGVLQALSERLASASQLTSGIILPNGN